eukprot:scaffold145526_cov148-Phaeocystis_antarctica.AAC.1
MSSSLSADISSHSAVSARRSWSRDSLALCASASAATCRDRSHRSVCGDSRSRKLASLLVLEMPAMPKPGSSGLHSSRKTMSIESPQTAS